MATEQLSFEFDTHPFPSIVFSCSNCRKILTDHTEIACSIERIKAIIVIGDLETSLMLKKFQDSVSYSTDVPAEEQTDS